MRWQNQETPFKLNSSRFPNCRYLFKFLFHDITSGVITALGMIVGLHEATSSRLAVFAGIVVMAITDGMADAAGILTFAIPILILFAKFWVYIFNLDMNIRITLHAGKKSS